MKILEHKPLTMAEVKEQIKGKEESKELHEYLEKFTQLDKKKAEELAQSIRELDNPKIKEEHIIKACDIVPKDSEDVNKIFIDASLSEDETNKILEITGKY